MVLYCLVMSCAPHSRLNVAVVSHDTAATLLHSKLLAFIDKSHDDEAQRSSLL